MPHIKTISDMRLDALGLLNSVSRSEKPTVIMHHSQPMAVMVSLEAFEKLLEFYEDAQDKKDALHFKKENKDKIDWKTHSDVFPSNK